jgi:NADH-quinone oxidoreductase subunit A
MSSSGIDYVPIVLQIGVIGGFVAFVLFITHYLGPRLKSKKKDASWECGVESKGDARFPVSIRYFMTAILFVLFDVEVIFFYPYAVNFKTLQLEGLLAVILFVAFFLIGFFYVLKKGALEWEK